MLGRVDSSKSFESNSAAPRPNKSGRFSLDMLLEANI